MDHSHTARLIEFLATTKASFVPEVVVRPEAIMKSFAQAINSADVEPSDPSTWDSLVLESAVNTEQLPPSDHYNLTVVALDYIVREGQGFDSAYADHLLYIMLRYLPKLPTFDPHFRHRGAAALSLLLYRDVGLQRLDAESQFTIAYLLMHHCRAAVHDLPRRVVDGDGPEAKIGDGVSEKTLRDGWHRWFKHDDLDETRFNALIADMAAWHAQLAADRPANSSNVDRPIGVAGVAAFQLPRTSRAAGPAAREDRAFLCVAGPAACMFCAFWCGGACKRAKNVRAAASAARREVTGAWHRPDVFAPLPRVPHGAWYAASVPQADKTRWDPAWRWRSDTEHLVFFVGGLAACAAGVFWLVAFARTHGDSSAAYTFHASCFPKTPEQGWVYWAEVGYKRVPSAIMWEECITVSAFRQRAQALIPEAAPAPAPERVALDGIEYVRLAHTYRGRPRILGEIVDGDISHVDVETALAHGGTHSRPSPRVKWIVAHGILSLPLLAFGSAATVLGAARWARRLVQRRRWGRFCCPWCGYALRGAQVCSECGRG